MNVSGAGLPRDLMTAVLAARPAMQQMQNTAAAAVQAPTGDGDGDKDFSQGFDLYM